MSMKIGRAVGCLLALLALQFLASACLAQKLPIGFRYADEDRDGKVSASEMKSYLDARLPDEELPHTKIFDTLDIDHDKHLSESEFDKRNEVLQQLLQDGIVVPIDPGKDFVPFSGLDQPIDDSKIMGALFHRYAEQLAEDAAWRDAGWKPLDLNELPPSVAFKAPSGCRASLRSINSIVRL